MMVAARMSRRVRVRQVIPLAPRVRYVERDRLACAVAIASTTSACCVLLDPRLDELLHECGGGGLVGGGAGRFFSRMGGPLLFPVCLADLHALGGEAGVGLV